MGCLSRIGCLTVLVVGGVGGYWLYGDRLPSVLSRAASRAANKVTSVATRASERLDSSDGSRIEAENEAARRAARRRTESSTVWAPLQQRPNASRQLATRLASRKAPAYVSLKADELAAVLATGLAGALPASASRPQLAIVDDQLLLRAVVDLADFAGEGAFGSVIGAALDGRDTIQFAGTLDLVKPGFAQYRVREIRVKGIDVPPRVIPSLIGTMRGRAQYDSLAPDALPVPLPKSVADVRIANGIVTLYKALRP